MHLVFMDGIPWPYRVDAPLTQPLGGTQSAACYLMMALAARGARVSFINSAAPHVCHGVTALGAEFPIAAIADADAFIVITDPDPKNSAPTMALAPQAKKILWQHFAPDQPVAAPLTDPAACHFWDAAVFVSAWQEQQFLNQFPALSDLPRKILRNAISPAFENLFEGLPVLAFKSPAPHLAYGSTPFRGLDRLLLAWPQILSAHPMAELQVFSSMQLYNTADTGPMAQLLANARLMPGITQVGPVPQPELAEALRSSLILAYPNTFAETACIAVMEAMAAGCIVVTSDLGALPETLAGHGELIPYQPDAHAHAANFAARLSYIMTDLKSQWHTGELESRLASQVMWANEHYSWTARAKEWEGWLSAAD